MYIAISASNRSSAILWNIAAVRLMWWRVGRGIYTRSSVGGCFCPCLARGMFTIWSRDDTDGMAKRVWFRWYRHILPGDLRLIGLVFVICQRIIMLWKSADGQDFDLQDHLNLILIYLFYGTVYFGIILIPLTFVSRYGALENFTVETLLKSTSSFFSKAGREVSG